MDDDNGKEQRSAGSCCTTPSHTLMRSSVSTQYGATYQRGADPNLLGTHVCEVSESLTATNPSGQSQTAVYGHVELSVLQVPMPQGLMGRQGKKDTAGEGGIEEVKRE